MDESSRPLAEDRLQKLANKEEVDQRVPMKVRRKSCETVDVEVVSLR